MIAKPAHCVVQQLFIPPAECSSTFPALYIKAHLSHWYSHQCRQNNVESFRFTECGKFQLIRNKNLPISRRYYNADGVKLDERLGMHIPAHRAGSFVVPCMDINNVYLCAGCCELANGLHHRSTPDKLQASNALCKHPHCTSQFWYLTCFPLCNEVTVIVHSIQTEWHYCTSSSAFSHSLFKNVLKERAHNS